MICGTINNCFIHLGFKTSTRKLFSNVLNGSSSYVRVVSSTEKGKGSIFAWSKKDYIRCSYESSNVAERAEGPTILKFPAPRVSADLRIKSAALRALASSGSRRLCPHFSGPAPQRFELSKFQQFFYTCDLRSFYQYRMALTEKRISLFSHVSFPEPIVPNIDYSWMRDSGSSIYIDSLPIVISSRHSRSELNTQTRLFPADITFKEFL